MLASPPKRFRPDPDPSRVHTLLFATIPFEYYADRAEYFAELGVEGAMLGGIMHNWDSDVWALRDGSRVVGEKNPTFQRCKKMNAACREVGIALNSVKVAFYKPLPDWFDNDGWAILLDNFRECAVFARDAGFAGVALDIEYIAQIYDFGYEPYRAPGYPREQLRDKARERGRQIMNAMIAEFPEMINWHLPEGIFHYGPLAADLFVGMLDSLAADDTPGGIHLCTERTYTETSPTQIVRFVHWLAGAIAEAADGPARDYWNRRGTICIGLWPLGYYREILDEAGKRLGYSGRKEVFGDQLVGSYADKSRNYPPDAFRAQLATARMLAGHSIWIYCHGSVLWHMSEDEQKRYGGSASDILPVAEDLDEFLAVLKERPVVDDPEFERVATAVREKQEINLLEGTGYPPAWHHIGPFPNEGGKGHDIPYPPEMEIDLDAEYEGASGPVSWVRHPVAANGFVSLQRIVSRKDYLLSYSVAWVESPEPTRVVIRFGSDDSAKIWVGGRLVHSTNTIRVAVEDEEAITVELPAGRVPILVKCGNYTGGWGFYLRVTDDAGKEIEGLRWESGA